MTTHLFHGIRTGNAKQALEGLATGLPSPQIHSYGYTIPPFAMARAYEMAEEVVDQLQDGDFLVGYSHGAVVTHLLARHPRAPAALGGVVLVQPALRRDTLWPDRLPVLCLYNRRDWTVEAGQLWGALVHADPTGWGSAGRHGITSDQPNVTNLNTGERYWIHPARGHTQILTDPRASYWASHVTAWMGHVTGRAA